MHFTNAATKSISREDKRNNNYSTDKNAINVATSGYKCTIVTDSIVTTRSPVSYSNKPISEKYNNSHQRNCKNLSRENFSDRDNFSDFDGNFSRKNRNNKNEQ